MKVRRGEVGTVGITGGKQLLRELPLGAGELGSWGTGELVSWGVGELASSVAQQVGRRAGSPAEQAERLGFGAPELT